MVVSICHHNQQSNEFCEEQQQNVKWSGLFEWWVLIHCFSLLGTPVKACTTHLPVQGGSVCIVGCGYWSATFWTASSSSEVLAEKSGLDGVCELVETNNDGRGSTSLSALLDVLYYTLSLFESITIAHIWFRDSRWPFCMQSLTVFLFAADKHTFPLQQQTLSCL